MSSNPETLGLRGFYFGGGETVYADHLRELEATFCCKTGVWLM